MIEKKVSVITPCFNSGKTIRKTLESVLNQTYQNFEYIIVDGKSTDNTANIIKENKAHISQWVSEPDTGIYNAMNKAVKMATGDYCLFLNAGDELYSTTTIEELRGNILQLKRLLIMTHVN